MTNFNQPAVEFRSKYFRDDDHQNCASEWNGFGFAVVCTCECHLSRTGMVMGGAQTCPRKLENRSKSADENVEVGP